MFPLCGPRIIHVLICQYINMPSPHPQFGGFDLLLKPGNVSDEDTSGVLFCKPVNEHELLQVFYLYFHKLQVAP